MINLKVILPTGITIDDKFDHVIIPGSEGDFGVSEGHTPFISSIRPGSLRLYKTNSRDFEQYSIHDGFTTIEDDEIIIITENFESKKEIDFERAEKSKARAEKRLESGDGSLDYRRAELALRRAIARIDLKE